jgi:hypothetical protein
MTARRREAIVPTLLVLSIAAWWHTAVPPPAIAAFELRDASPAALGAVSMDREAGGFFEEDPARGASVHASHAALYEIEGLTSEQAGASARAGGFRIALGHAQVGAPGAREHATRLSIREESARAVALSLHVERLALALEGEPPGSLWTLAAGVRGRAHLGSVRCDVALTADRVARRGGLPRDAVTPALPWSVRLRARGASLEIADRWEGDGRTSPRLSFDLMAGRNLALRFGRGERPGRTGAAAAIRLGRLEISVGRQDDEYGGTVSSASVALLPGGPKR